MLFFMRSPSCGGKDTFIRKHFMKEGGQVISSDAFRELLTGDINNQQMNERVFSLMAEVLDFRLANRVSWTVVNATNLRMRDCSRFVDIAKKHHTPFMFICIAPPSREILHERAISRQKQTGMIYVPEVIDKHYDRYESAARPFIEEATYNANCKLIEVNQSYEVIREI